MIHISILQCCRHGPTAVHPAARHAHDRAAGRPHDGDKARKKRSSSCEGHEEVRKERRVVWSVESSTRANALAEERVRLMPSLRTKYVGTLLNPKNSCQSGRYARWEVRLYACCTATRDPKWRRV